MTIKANATYDWLNDLDSLQHVWAHLKQTFSCPCLHVWTDVETPDLFLLSSSGPSFVQQQICLNAFNVGDFHATLRLYGNSHPERIYTYVLIVIIMSFLLRHIAQGRKNAVGSHGGGRSVNTDGVYVAYDRAKLSMHLCRLLCVFRIHWGFWGEIRPPINSFYKSKSPSRAGRSLPVCNFLKVLFQNIIPNVELLDDNHQEKQTCSHVPAGFL